MTLNELLLWVTQMQGNKTPFEVRLDVLKMAQDMLDREHQIEQNKFFAKLETLRASNTSADVINTYIDNNSPKMYEPSEVVARSSALYAFVNNTTTNKP
jgi:hypothetical protein